MVGELSGPWFDPWREDAQQVAHAMNRGAALHDALNAGSDAPVHFVAADELPPDTPYETCVFETRRCPVRDGTHDFFNGLVWRRFPRAKSQLNAVHAVHIREHGIAAVRGPVRDGATLFDENGALLFAPPALWEALAQRDWKRLFVDLRPLWAEASVTVFGHALLEKLLSPRKEITAHIWVSTAGHAGRDPALMGACLQGRDPALMEACLHGLRVEPAMTRSRHAGLDPASIVEPSASQIDDWLAAELTPSRLAAKPFLPLPLMGIPGWSPGNADISFYDDARVFRPARQQETGPCGPRTTQP